MFGRCLQLEIDFMRPTRTSPSAKEVLWDQPNDTDYKETDHEREQETIEEKEAKFEEKDADAKWCDG